MRRRTVHGTAPVNKTAARVKPRLFFFTSFSSFTKLAIRVFLVTTHFFEKH